jgi:catechol-2,3-dioxygenase
MRSPDPRPTSCWHPQPNNRLTAARRLIAVWRDRSGGNRLTASPERFEAVAMTSRISHTSLDAINAYAQSVFWSQVLGFAEDPDDPNEPGHEECLIMSRDRSQLLLFITVPDGKRTV